MDYEEACLNALCGPDYQHFLENSFPEEAPKIKIFGGSVTEETDYKPGQPETEPNSLIQTDMVGNLSCVTDDSSTRCAKLKSTIPNISEEVTGGKKSNKANLRVMDRNWTKDASGKEAIYLHNGNNQLETPEAKIESKTEARSKSKEEVKVQTFSRILPFLPSIRIIKKNPEFSSSKRMNNYDVESDIESIDHSKATTMSSYSANKDVVTKSINEMQEDISSEFDKSHNESAERTELLVMIESELVGKDIDDLPDPIDVIQRTEAACSSTFSQDSNDKVPFQVAFAVKLADFINSLNNVRIGVTSFFSKLTNIRTESIKCSCSQGADNVEQLPADTDELYEDVQSLDADFSQSDYTKKHEKPLSLPRSVILRKPNFRIPPLHINKKQLITKMSTPLQRPGGRKGEQIAPISKGVSRTPNMTSIQSRPNHLRKSFLFLIQEKTEPDSSEYEYDEFPGIRKDDHDYDIYENFVRGANSIYELGLPRCSASQDEENLYYNEDVIVRANKVVIEEPPPLPPKTSKPNPSDRVSKHRCDVPHRQKICNRQRDVELPRRSISQEKGVAKGFVKISKKFVLKTPFSSSRREGEGKRSQPTMRQKVKQGNKEERRVVIDNGDAYEEEISITQLADFQDSNEGEYELYGDIPSNHQTENKYLELLSAKGRPLDNAILRRILPEIPRPNIESTSECKRNVRCSFTKTPKPKITNDQRDLPPQFRGNYHFNASQDNPRSKTLELSVNLKFPSSEKTNEVAEKMISKKIPPVIPARPESIPSHIISRLSTPVPKYTQNHSTISSVCENERPSDEQMMVPITENDGRSVDIQERSKENGATSAQRGSDSSALVCDNDVYMYMADCYS
nr:hypothetical protein HmN_000572600 [Hymenolepis microstoma]